MRNIMMLLLVVGFSFAACEKSSRKCDPSAGVGERIQGSWELVQVFNPWTNETHAPTDAERETLVFGKDSVTVIDHQYLMTRTAYSFSNGWLTSGGPNGQVTIDSATCNTLIIDNTPVDGPRKTYGRVLDE